MARRELRANLSNVGVVALRSRLSASALSRLEAELSMQRRPSPVGGK